MAKPRFTTLGISQQIGILVVVAGLATLPFLLDDYSLHWAIIALMYVVIALAWDLLARTGQSSFGQVGFFGLGAYASAITAQTWNINPIAAIFISSIGVGAVAALCSALFLRVRGIYFAILTLALAEVFKVGATELAGITEGPMGLTMPPLFAGDMVWSYFFVLLAAIACVVGIAIMQRSKLSYGIIAIRSNQEVAAAFGVPVKLIKISVFTTGAMVTGVMGGFYAFYTSYINPQSVFDTTISVAPVIMCIFGGLYTIVGPIIGAVFLTIFEEALRTEFESGSLVVYGLLLVVSILFMPQGVWGMVRVVWARIRPAGNAAAIVAERFDVTR
jgi:branched-chain amino acid transport system permease protein